MIPTATAITYVSEKGIIGNQPSLGVDEAYSIAEESGSIVFEVQLIAGSIPGSIG